MYVRQKKDQTKPLIALEPEERGRLLEKVDGEHTLRVRFTVRTLMHTGMRAAELAHMKESWLDGPSGEYEWSELTETPMVRIPGLEPCRCTYCRTQAERNVARHSKMPNRDDDDFEDAVEEKLTEYWKPKSHKGQRSVPIHYEETWRVMREHLGNVGEVQVTPNALWKRVHKAGAGLEFEHDLTCHALRHTFATMFAENEAPVDLIKRMMGHTKAETSEEYIELTGAQTASQSKKYAPEV